MATRSKFSRSGAELSHVNSCASSYAVSTDSEWHVSVPGNSISKFKPASSLRLPATAFGWTGILILLIGLLASGDTWAKWAAEQVVSGGSHSCALLNDGLVKCWGENNLGQLGLGDTNDRGDVAGEMGGTLPYVDLGTDEATGRRLKAVELTAGGTFNCARLENGAVKCWGLNAGTFESANTTGHGHLGLNDFDVASDDPVQLRLRAVGDQPDEMGRNLKPAVLTDGSEKARPLKALGVSAGNEHACARLEDGRVNCWGHNDSGRLGLGTSTEAISDNPNEMGDSLRPVNLGDGLTAAQLSAGYSRSCALLNNGLVKCWGRNVTHCEDLRSTVARGEAVDPEIVCRRAAYPVVFYEDGQLGLPLPTFPPEATPDRGDEPGEMGDALDPVPILPRATEFTITKLSNGPLAHHVCAIMDDGGVKCWGSNWYGQLGLGDTENRGDESEEMRGSLPFLALGEGRTATQVATGEFFTCAVLDNGSVKCWGRNEAGQLGQGTLSDSLVPVDVSLDSSIQAIDLAAGMTHVCVRLNNGAVKCWGNNSHGQLGLGDTSNRGDNELVAVLPAVDFGGPSIVATKNASEPSNIGPGTDIGRFTISLGSSPAPSGGITINYQVSGTATGIATETASQDYQPLSGSVLIPEGQTTATVDVIPLGDTIEEKLETVTLTLVPETGNFVDPGAAENSASLVIVNTNQDPTSDLATIQATDPNASETGADPGLFTISLSKAAERAVTVRYALTGTATPGSDYLALTGSIVIPTGQTSASLNVTPIDDAVCEGAETVLVTLTQPSESDGYEIDPNALPITAAITIGDNDCVNSDGAQVAASQPNAVEKKRKPGAFTISVSPAATAATTISYTVGGTATEGEDYDPLPGTAQIPNGATSVTIPIVVKNDRLKEGPESVVLTLRSAGGYPLKAPNSATVTITDDESPDALRSACQVRQLDAAAQMYRDLASCQRSLLSSDDQAENQSCRNIAKATFATRFDNIVAFETGCALTLAGENVAEQWVQLMDEIINPLLNDWKILPDKPFREAARLRRFLTASKVVERSTRNALVKAEGPYVQDGNQTKHNQKRAAIRGELVHKMRNVKATRNDYNGPNANQFKVLVDDAVNAISAQVSTPTRLEPLQIVTGDRFTCTRFNNLTMKCWGANSAGQLGLGDTAARGDAAGEMADNLPLVDLGSGRLVLELAAGGRHVCARLNSGFVKCWGDNSFGQLGLGDNLTRGDEPGEMADNLPTVDLGSGRSAVEIQAGDVHTCARMDDGSTKCWGGNSSGQLGLGDTVSRGTAPGEMGDALLALDFGTGLRAQALGLGFNHSCARLSDNTVKCWGQNLDGALGLGDSENRGDGPGEMGGSLDPVALRSGWTVGEIAAGRHFTCALSEAGEIACWGTNQFGQLGEGSTLPRGGQQGQMDIALPSLLLGSGRKAEGLALGSAHACAQLDDGSLKCWGQNDSGQLGLGDIQPRGDQSAEMGDALPPTELGAGRLVAKIAAGHSHTCALLNNGSVKCWGSNAQGGLGVGDIEARGVRPGQMGDNLPAIDFGAASNP